MNFLKTTILTAMAIMAAQVAYANLKYNPKTDKYYSDGYGYNLLYPYYDEQRYNTVCKSWFVKEQSIISLLTATRHEMSAKELRSSLKGAVNAYLNLFEEDYEHTFGRLKEDLHKYYDQLFPDYN